MSATSTSALPEQARALFSALGPVLNQPGCDVGRVEQNLYGIADGSYISAFLINSIVVVHLDGSPRIGNRIERPVDETDRDLFLENNRR